MRKAICRGIGAGLALMLAAHGAGAKEDPVPAKEVVQTVQAVPSGAAIALEKIEIRIGNEIVSTSDIEEPMRQYREHFSLQLRGSELEAKMRETREKHIDRLIESKLLLLEAREQKIELQDSLVDEQLDKEIENVRAQFPSHQAFKEQLAKEHLTESEFREKRKGMIRENILRQRLLQSKIQEFKTGAEVSDAQLEAYYEENRKKFTRPVRAEVRQIFVTRPDTEMSNEDFQRAYQEKRQKIRRAQAELKSGKPFTEVARKYSEHKPTAEKGGDIGWLEEGGVGLPEFEKAAFQQVPIGQYSEILETAKGFFIIQVQDKQPGGQMPLEEVRGRIRQEIMAESSEKRYQAWIETLKKKYKIIYPSNHS
ncbi:peptidylprolyl isomerase [candidate division FCPU426 bacterium]|nr:peptidylprolyl isomerase [candidate division FCPU426 bacterium]